MKDLKKEEEFDYANTNPPPAPRLKQKDLFGYLFYENGEKVIKDGR